MQIFAFSFLLTVTFVISKRQNILYESNLREFQIQYQIVKSSFYSPGKPHPTAAPTRLQQSPTTVQHSLTLKDLSIPNHLYIKPTDRRDCAPVHTGMLFQHVLMQCAAQWQLTSARRKRG